MLFRIRRNSLRREYGGCIIVVRGKVYKAFKSNSIDIMYKELWHSLDSKLTGHCTTERETRKREKELQGKAYL